MCGIAGFFNTRGPIDKNILERMTESIRHRGPDGSGTRLFANGGIGNRRLSIIDLPGGAQPLSNEDGSIWITFNGEIYNYAELRVELQRHGHHFKTKSDTEVAVHAYEEWGPPCLKRIRGMFAFGIVDTREKRVFLARDHFGIKPLYYLHNDEIFAFASELRQFRHINPFPLKLNFHAIDMYLSWGYIPAPFTVFQNVYKLRPAHSLLYSFEGKLETPENYWQIDFSKKEKKDKREWLRELDHTLKQSVQAHLVSDVPVGAFLSGGIDSTLVVAYMSQLAKQPVKTFSIGFDDEIANEAPFSEQAAKILGTEHYCEILTSDALDILPDLVRNYGEPFGDSSSIAVYHLSRLARTKVPAVLSGDGGDECFAGYRTYGVWASAQQPRGFVSHARRLLPFLPQQRSRTQDWFKIIKKLNASWRALLWRPEFASAFTEGTEEFIRLFQEAKDFTLANQAQYIDLKTYLPFDILTKVDIASMSHGLEVRTPFVDKEVWEFAATIPETLNIARTWRGDYNGKLLLKDLLSQFVPSSFIHRPKHGFFVPLHRWFADSRNRSRIHEYLFSSNSRILNFFHKKKVQLFVKKSRAAGIWLLLFLEAWLRDFEEFSGQSVKEQAPSTIDSLKELRRNYRPFAQRLLNERRYSEALEVTAEGIAESPDDTKLQILHVRAYLGLGRTAEAMEFVRKAATMHKDQPEFLRVTCTVLLEMGLLDVADDTARKALELYPENFSLRVVRSRIDEMRNGTSTMEQSIARWGPILQEDLQQPEAIIHLSNAIERHFGSESAKESVDKLLSSLKTEEFGVIPYLEGRFALACGNYPLAQEKFGHAYREGYDPAATWEVKAYYKAGLLEQAELIARAHAEGSRDSILKAELFQSAGMSEECYEILNRAMKTEERYRARKKLIRIAFRNGDWGLAYSALLSLDQKSSEFEGIRNQIEAGYATATLPLPADAASAAESLFSSSEVARAGIVRRVLSEHPPREFGSPAKVAMVLSSMVVGGSERQCLNIANALAERAEHKIANVTVLSADLQRKRAYLPLVRPGVKVVEFYKRDVKITINDVPELEPFVEFIELIRPYSRQQRILQLGRALADIQPDIVHVWSPEIVDPALVSSMLKVPIIVARWGSIPPAEANKVAREKLQRWQTGYLEIGKLPNLKFACNSTTNAAAYADFIGVPVERVHIVKNTIDDRTFHKTPESRQRLRNSLGIPLDAPVMGGAFRFVESKQPYVWIEVAELLTRRYPQMHFVLLGDGRIWSQVKQHILSKGTTGFHLPGEQHNMSDWYSVMDLFLHTSSVEGVSNVLMEAQWHGLPVVAQRIGGLEEAVLQDQTGILVSKADPETFAAAVESILDDPDRYASMTREAETFARANFSLEAGVTSTLELYGIR